MRKRYRLPALLLALSLSVSPCRLLQRYAQRLHRPRRDRAESDLAYVQDKGTLVVGITNFAPMDYKEEGSDEWVGFDADMARAFAESLGVEVEFSEITWDYKVMELDAKSVDVLWNGMTLTDEVKSSMDTSVPYCTNYQSWSTPRTAPPTSRGSPPWRASLWRWSPAPPVRTPQRPWAPPPSPSRPRATP